MIDPQNIINYNRTDAELEEVLLFLVLVAGKTASVVSRQLEGFLQGQPPFTTIRQIDDLEGALKAHRTGQYTRTVKAFRQLVNSGMNLRTCTLDDLTAIHGIGRKSASCFLMWTRRGQRVSGLDTHLLAELRELGHDAPKSTPGSKKVYDRLEKVFLDLADAAGMSPEDFDLAIWKKRSLTKRKGNVTLNKGKK